MMSSEHKEHQQGEAQDIAEAYDRQPHLAGGIGEDFLEKMAFKLKKNG